MNAAAPFKVVTLTDAAPNASRKSSRGRPADRRRARRREERRLRRHVLHDGDRRGGQSPRDEVVEDKGVSVLVDPKAVLFLLGTEMDFQTTKLRRSSSSATRTRPRPAAAAKCVAITPAKPDTLQAAE